MVDWSSSSRVSPFRYLRINVYLQLPVAFRSLSRLSSALSAKASTLRSFLLDLVASVQLSFIKNFTVYLLVSYLTSLNTTFSDVLII